MSGEAPPTVYGEVVHGGCAAASGVPGWRVQLKAKAGTTWMWVTQYSVEMPLDVAIQRCRELRQQHGAARLEVDATSLSPGFVITALRDSFSVKRTEPWGCRPSEGG